MNDSEVLITGASGQLGSALSLKYPNAKKADITILDITDENSVNNFDWDGVKIIINAAAYTKVDEAETDSGRVAAWKVNATAVSYLARVAKEKDITLVHISTDYVFDGTKNNHLETEDYSPLSVYGASKAGGDLVAASTPKYYILRTSWVIGEGKNFVRTMLDLGARNISPTVVNDQIGRLTFTNQLVSAIDLLLKSRAPFGIYNITNEGEKSSWADITRQIFDDAGYALTVSNTTTKEYFAGKENIAPRPLNSMLDLSKIKAIGFVPSDWKEDLKEYVKKELQK